MIMTPARIKRYQEGGDVMPYVSGVRRDDRSMDPIMQQMLFGLGGQGGFIPGAMRAAERTFFDEQGRPIVVPQEIAGFSPDQISAMNLARGSVGSQQPYLDEAQSAYQRGVGALGQGNEAQLEAQRQAMASLQGGAAEEGLQRQAGLTSALGGIDQARDLSQGAYDQFGRDLSAQQGYQSGAVDQYGNALGKSTEMLRGTTGAYDQSMTDQFFDPYEERVVQQTIQDAVKGATQQDIGQVARDIGSAGESAFGSRARLGAAERAEALGRGLAKEVGGIRSAGFQRAQQAGMGEFARQQQAQRTAASGMAGLAGQQFGAQQGYGGLMGQQAQQRLAAGTGLGQSMFGFGQAGQAARTGAGQAALGTAGQLAQGYGALGGVQGQIGQNMFGAQQGYGGFLQGLGQQRQGATAADVNMLSGMGGMQQQMRQQQLDAQRAGLLQAQQAPLNQYNALMPFMAMAGQQTGPSTVQTSYAPPPSPLQAGLGVGLGALGALGNYFNQGGQQPTNTTYGQQPTNTMYRLPQPQG
tara:strand:- start:5093 stop:6667 length:1575 start_codon:yes stop_codon:yes gene_type:complete